MLIKSKPRLTAYFALLLSLILAPASAMSGATFIDCEHTQKTVQQYRDFKKTTDRFYVEYEGLDNGMRSTLLQNDINKILGIMGDFAMFTGNDSLQQRPLYVESAKLIDDLKSKDITRSAAERPMKQGLLNLQNYMEDLISRAQSAHPDCSFSSAKVSSTTSSQ